MRFLGRLAVLVAALLFAGSSAWATDYYFSGCGCGTGPCGGDACGNVVIDASRVPPPTPAGSSNNTYGDPWVSNACADVPPGLPGGHIGENAWRLALTPGSIDDPWCLAPEITNADCISAGVPNACCTGLDAGTCPSYKKTSLAAMMDGGAGAYLPTDLVSGDRVYFCAGQCNGSGTETWPIQPPGTAWLTPRAGVNSVTLTAYPGETVILSGDSDLDGIPDSGEGERIIDQAVNGNTGWTVQDLTFERWTTDNDEEVFYLNNNPSGWTFDNVEVGYVGGYAWSGEDLGNTSCSNNNSPHVFKVADLTGNLTIKNSRFHHNCAFIDRFTVNPAAGAILIENNEYWNNIQVSNYFQTRNLTIRGNYMHDNYGGVGIEQQMVNVLIEDNRIACEGVYKVGAGGRCNDAISVSDGNNPGEGGIITTGVTIRRNRIWGKVAGAFTGAGNGWFNNIISFTAGSDTPIATVIENNLIWHEQGWANSCLCLTSGCCAGESCNPQVTCTPGVPSNEWAGPAILISSNRADPTEIKVQNNTIYDSKVGIVLHGSTTGRAYTVRDNLIARSRKGTTVYPAIVVTARALDSVVQNNLIDRNDRASGAASTERIAWISTGVGGNGNYKFCTDTPTLGLANGSGNLCGPSRFTLCDTSAYCACGGAGQPACTSSYASWDLHLGAPQAAVDAGVSGATCDYDQQPRPANGVWDIGADERWVAGEVGASGTVPPPYVPSAEVALD